MSENLTTARKRKIYALLRYIQGESRGKGFCNATNEGIARHFGISQRSAQRRVSEARKYGYLKAYYSNTPPRPMRGCRATREGAELLMSFYKPKLEEKMEKWYEPERRKA